MATRNNSNSSAVAKRPAVLAFPKAKPIPKKQTRKKTPQKKTAVKKTSPQRKRTPTSRKPSEKQLLTLRFEALENTPTSEMGVADQMWLACSPKNMWWTVGFSIVGGCVPLFSFATAHLDNLDVNTNAKWSMIIGGLTFSCITVYRWARRLFSSRSDHWWSRFLDFSKAAGFVILTESVMIASGITWLTYLSLILLIFVNGIATGTNVALDRWRWKPQQQGV